MNRFEIRKGAEEAFKAVWRNRDSHLKQVPGFVAFHLLEGPGEDGHTLFVSHTIWASREAFTEWTRSEAFRQAHQQAGGHRDLYLGPPRFEGFEVVQEIR